MPFTPLNTHIWHLISKNFFIFEREPLTTLYMKWKITSTAVLLFWLFPVYSNAQQPDPVVFKISEGDVLVYDVRDKGDLYYFMVTVKEYKNSILFDWEMTEPMNKKGSVEIRPKALSNSKELVNYVKEAPVVLEDKTIVWLSRNMFKEITGGSVPDITFDGKAGNKMTVTGNSKQNIQYKGKSLEVDVVEVTNNQSFFDLKKLAILNSSDNPLIVRMNIGFTVELVEVR